MSAGASITYLALVDGDIQWNAPLYDLAAVEQAIYTRLLLFQGEWWASLTDGLPLWQSILANPAGIKSQQMMATLISNRIEGTPYVIGLANVSITFNQRNRSMSYSATVNTQFGTVQVSDFPVPPASGGS